MHEPRIIRQETAQVVVTFPKVPVFVVICKKCGARVHLYGDEVWRWTLDHRVAQCADYACKPPRRTDQPKSSTRIESWTLQRDGFDCSFTQKGQAFVADCKLGGCHWMSRPGDADQVVAEVTDHFNRGHQKRSMVLLMNAKVLQNWLRSATVNPLVVA